MWSRHKKLKEWVAAGVLTEPQAQAIEAYEATRKKGHFGRGLVNLSVFAILVGILSIIASNWYKIPGEVKIGVHLLLNAGIGVFALWADKKGRDVWREGATLAFIGLSMTLIILVGQVFQLVGSITSAMTLWMIITFPFFILMGRTYATAVPWMIAFLITLGMNVGDYVEDLPEYYQAYFYIGLAALLPLALMADGVLDIFRRWRPALAEVFLKTGGVLSAICASAVISAWGYFTASEFRGHQDDVQTQTLVILGAGLAAMGAHAVFHKFYKNNEGLKYGALFALTGLLLTTLPFLIPDAGNRVLAAIIFIAYWIFIGWLGQGMGHMRLVSLAIIVIAIRIYGIYVELFGSLLTTGIGLISGGVVMLALIYGARKLNTRIRAKGALNGTL